MPTMFSLLKAVAWSSVGPDRVSKMWILKNGDQLVCQTTDGVFHKLNILQNTHHDIIVGKGKGKELTFEMTNNGRNFYILSNRPKFIDFDLIDRVIHMVPIDTKRY